MSSFTPVASSLGQLWKIVKNPYLYEDSVSEMQANLAGCPRAA